MEEIYDMVSHEFDEQVCYGQSAQYPDAYVFHSSDLMSYRFETEYKDVMKELLSDIKEEAIYNDEDEIYIIKQDRLCSLLENFYEKGAEKERD